MIYRKKRHRVSCSLNDNDYGVFMLQVIRSSLTVQQYLYQLIQGNHPRASPTLDFQEVIHQLREISKKMNELCAISKSNSDVNFKIYQENYNQLNKEILEIRRIILLPERSS